MSRSWVGVGARRRLVQDPLAFSNGNAEDGGDHVLLSADDCCGGYGKVDRDEVRELRDWLTEWLGES